MQRTLLLASPKEQSLGFRYTLFAVTFMSSVLSLITTALGFQLQVLELNLTYFFVNFVILGVIFRRFLTASLKDLAEKWVQILAVSAVGFVLYWLTSLLLSTLITYLYPDFGNANDSNIADLAREDYYLTTIGTVLLVPLAEECMHRAAIFGGIYRKNRLLAYCISTILFALVHIDGYFGMVSGKILLLNFLQYLPAGVFLAAAYDISGSIFAPIFIHMAVNLLGIFSLR